MKTNQENVSENDDGSRSSGVSGIYWDPRRFQWHVDFSFHGQRFDLGRFYELVEAKEAMNAVKTRLSQIERVHYLRPAIPSAFDKLI